MSTTRSTCPYCGVGCGVVVTQTDQGAIQIRPDVNHPANQGKLCSKGSALAETLQHPDRLLYPEIYGQRSSWSDAIQTIADKFTEIIQMHGADAVAFYVSGQLLTEDYYVANKLMKGFIGSANIDTNSRLCMSSAVAAHKRAFGEDLVACTYEDLDEAELIVLVGSNTAWCHPVLYQRIAKAKQTNPALKIITIDPRRTQTTEMADLHLGLKPSTDAILFNGLLVYLAANGYQDSTFIEYSTEGLDTALHTANLSSPTIAAVAQQCQLTETEVRQFFQLFAHTEKVITVFSQGINQSSSGVDKGNSLINCHLLTGRIGKVGAGAFSFTGQPNAMGGREVGGLANQLAAHMELDNPIHRERVQRFWQSPTIATKAGLKAVDLFQAIEQGTVKAVWIMATNPAVSLPDTEQVKRALAQCELVVVSDCVRHTDTNAFAHVLLPALTWGERNGTVTNSERCISRQHPFLAPPAEARQDWQIICAVAKAMGYGEHFNYQHLADIFREHVALSAFENRGERCFDLSAWQDLSTEAYDQLRPTQWPIMPKTPQGTKRLFTEGRFFTPSGKARFMAVTPRMPHSQPSTEYPLILNTGRVRDHWHTLTRTGMTERLSAHSTEPYVEIHPDDALHYGLQADELAEVYNERGSLILRVSITQTQQKGSVFVPMHWNQQFTHHANVGTLIPAYVDPLSGQPESKHATVAIRPYVVLWHGFILSRTALALRTDYSCAHKIANGWCYDIASHTMPQDSLEYLQSLLSIPNQGHYEWCEYIDSKTNTYRIALLQAKRLVGCVFISHERQHLPTRDWLISLFAQDELNSSERQSLLAGQLFGKQKSQGRIICTCFNVGENTLRETIATQQVTTVEAIGKCLKAGTNCGSCITELAQLLKSQ